MIRFNYYHYAYSYYKFEEYNIYYDINYLSFFIDYFKWLVHLLLFLLADYGKQVYDSNETSD